MWRSFIPLFIIVIILALAFGLSNEYLFSQFQAHHKKIAFYVTSHPYQSPLIFTLVYAISTLFSLPIAGILSLIGGFLFILPYSMIYVVSGATIGACGIFSIVRTCAPHIFQNKAVPYLKTIEQHTRHHAWNYLLCLRFIPVIPFWLINIVPAFTSIRFVTFFWTTLVGIIPGAYAYTQAGEGLKESVRYQEISILNVKLVLGLTALAILAVIPLFIKKSIIKK